MHEDNCQYVDRILLDLTPNFDNLAECCENIQCEKWKRSFPNTLVPVKHWHCKDEKCPSKKVLGLEPGFSSQYASELKRHIMKVHKKKETIVKDRTRQILRYVLSNSVSSNRKVYKKFITGFRKRLLEKEDFSNDNVLQLSDDAILNWRNRLLVGKTGQLSNVLTESLQRFGTCPVTSMPDYKNFDAHTVESDRPKIGQIFRCAQDGLSQCTNVTMNDASDEWYGLCCSSFTQQNLDGCEGMACSIRWFELSHVGIWRKEPAKFYSLLTCTQQLPLSCMVDWGSILIFDSEQKLFVRPSQDKHILDTIGDPEYTNKYEKWYEEYIKEDAEEKNGYTFSNEDVIYGMLLFPEKLLYYCDAKTKEVIFPDWCSRGKENEDPKLCEWEFWARTEIAKKPMYTNDGPIFLRPIIYRCKRHNRHFTCGAGQFAHTNPFNYSVPHYRLGDMKYDVLMLSDLHASYVEALTIQSVHRELLRSWLRHTLRILYAIKRKQMHTASLDSRRLMRTTRFIQSLPDLLPSVYSLADLQLVIFQNTVKGLMSRYDTTAAAFDGQIIRIDGTFKCAAVVHIHMPYDAATKSSKRITKRVAGCALVAVGTEGLMLGTPCLVPGETNASIQSFVQDILKRRRQALGGISAPAAFVTDCIRRHRQVLWTALLREYPELNLLENTKTQYDNTCQDIVLMLQDIPHREWAFTRRVAKPKTHSDYADYCASIRDVFHCLRLEPHESQNFKIWKKKIEQWESERSEDDLNATKEAFMMSVTCHHEATKYDDAISSLVLKELNSACILLQHKDMNICIPSRVLARACRRLNFPEDDVKANFCCYGYLNDSDFLEHLKGVNEYYRTPRNLGRMSSGASVMKAIGTKWICISSSTSNGKQTKRRRTHARYSSNIEDGLELEDYGITSGPNYDLCVDAERTVRDEATLCGLHGHRLISNLQTDETIVEAVNKQLNSNVRQGSIGVDVAEMRLTYQRLKWDSAALQRILFGNTTKKRRANVQVFYISIYSMYLLI